MTKARDIADFKFENNSRDKAELFIAGCEVTPNS